MIMKTFITDNFLLQNDYSIELYHNFAKNNPIIDYHSHLIPMQIAQNRKFDNIAQLWLSGDHYKWRAMRSAGINEKYITGNASDKEKFLAWAKTVPMTLRNPLYHWTHLELLRYFGIDEILNPDSAEMIWDKTSQMLKSDDYSSWNLIKNQGVEICCTTDDPIDSLEYHKQIKEKGFSVKVLPSWRPDKVYIVDNLDNFNNYLDKLSEVSGINIYTFDTMFDALDNRINFFHQNGCRLADFGADYLFATPYTDAEVKEIFVKLRSKKQVSQLEKEKYKSAVLYRLCLQVHKLGWTQQFHLGPIRNTNTRLLSSLGPDTGFDSIGDFMQAESMYKFFDKLDSSAQLAKSIIYNINPADNEVFATMIGNYQDGSVAGKMQWGSAWWFHDQKDGIKKQLDCLSCHGLLSKFVGMLTDSRSFLSYTRHEYFRRILCNTFGTDIQNGELPNDINLIGGIINDICYNNAKNYFNF